MERLKCSILLIISLLVSCTNSDEPFFLIKNDGLYGYIEINGNEIIKPQFSYATNFKDNLAYARKDSIYGFINRKGEFIIKGICPEFEFYGQHRLSIPTVEIDPFKYPVSPYYYMNFKYLNNKLYPDDVLLNEGLAIFLDPESNKYGYINKRGRYVIQPKYDLCGKFSNGLAMIMKAEKIDSSTTELSTNTVRKFGYINKEGQIIIEPKYTSATDFSEGLCIVSLHVISEPQGMIQINPFSHGFAKTDSLFQSIINNGNGARFINTMLQPTSEIYFQDAKDFSEGYAAIKLNDKWGFINTSFNHLLDIKYDNAQSFSEGLAPVKLGGKWGYLGKNNKIYIDFKYDSCTVFRNGLAYVWLMSGKYKFEGYIDKDATIVWHKDTFVER